jgi:predicted  nucleic acid-binding Zn-ribbon protein
MNELNSLRSEIVERNNEINNLHTLVDKIQDDKNKLTKKISKLLENGINLKFLLPIRFKKK